MKLINFLLGLGLSLTFGIVLGLSLIFGIVKNDFLRFLGVTYITSGDTIVVFLMSLIFSGAVIFVPLGYLGIYFYERGNE